MGADGNEVAGHGSQVLREHDLVLCEKVPAEHHPQGMETRMGRGPWSTPTPAQWDLGWQVHLWSRLRHPGFSSRAAEEIAHGLTPAQAQAVWAATRTFQSGRLNLTQHTAVVMLRHELLRAADAADRDACRAWIAVLWRDADTRAAGRGTGVDLAGRARRAWQRVARPPRGSRDQGPG